MFQTTVPTPVRCELEAVRQIEPQAQAARYNTSGTSDVTAHTTVNISGGGGGSSNSSNPHTRSTTDCNPSQQRAKSTHFRCHKDTCEYICKNRAELFRHIVRVHGQYGKGNVTNLQPPPWEETEDPFEHLENATEIQNIYADNSIFILSPHFAPYDETKRIYNFPVNGVVTDEDIESHMKYIFTRQGKSYKFNVSAGVILENVETGELRYYRPGLNSHLLETAIYVSDRKSMENAKNTLIEQDLNAAIKKYKLNTKYKVLYITQLEYYVYLTDFVLGGKMKPLPMYISANKSILSTDRNSAGMPYQSNMCVFVALAKHDRVTQKRPHRDVIKLAESKYEMWNSYRVNVLGKPAVIPGKFKGVQFTELPDIENCFQINLTVMTLQPDRSCTTVYISTTDFNQDVYFHMYENHVNLIVNVAKLSHRHRCNVCEKLFRRPQHLRRHMLSCRFKTRYYFPGGYYHQEKSIFERLEEIGVNVKGEIFYPYFAVWDMEAMLMPPEMQTEMKQSKLIHEHRAVSCSICSNVPGYEEPFTIMDESVKSLINRMMVYLCEIRAACRILCYEKWGHVLKSLNEMIEQGREREKAYQSDNDSEGDSDDYVNDDNDLGDQEKGEEKLKRDEDPYLKQLTKLRDELVLYIERLILLTFNGGRYDLNLVREEMILFMMASENQTVSQMGDSYGYPQELQSPKGFAELEMGKCSFIKRGNNYLSISNNWFRMLDIINYLAGGTSYRKFLKAFGVQEAKYVFPYTYVNNFNVLSETHLPPFDHDCWYSDLKESNLLGEEYAEWVEQGQKGEKPPTAEEKYNQILRDWNEKGWRNMGDYLMYYNSMDTGPFVTAVQKLQALYFSLGVDIFKCSIGLPSASRKMLFKYAREQDINFALCDKANKDLYLMMRKHLVAGPALIFTRFMQVGETPLHPEGKISKSIEGYDFNSLYLSLFREKMPTGDFVRRFREDHFIPHYKTTYSKMYYWLKYRELLDNVKIKTRLTDGEEVRAGKYPLDGFCLLENGQKVAYNLDGCGYHGKCTNPHCVLSKKLKGKNVFGEDVTIKTQQRNEYLANHGYKHVIITECEFDKLVTENQWLRENFDFKARNPFTQKHKGKVSREDILKGVKDGSLYGYLLVDISVPEQLKGKYKHFPPIFVNQDITPDVVGEHMQQHISENNIKLTSRRLLVSDMQATEILLSSDLLRFYITELDLQCTEVYQVVEYVGKNVFDAFVNEVTRRRLEGARDPEKEPIANLFKTIGNSSYGSTILNKFRYSRIKHVIGGKNARLLVNDPKFKSLTKIGDSDLYEIESAPSRTRVDVPIQVGLMILMSAKRKLLEFYYNFLYKYIHPSDFTVMQIDTDSFYLSFSKASLLESVREEQQDVVRNQIYNNCALERDPDAFLCRDCCPEHRLCDSKFPGLLKLEYKCQTMICLNSKTYFCYNGGKDVKFSCKGLNKNKVLALSEPIELYKKTLQSQQSHGAVNKGFKLYKGKIYTYSQERHAFSYMYLKRQVLGPDGIYTEPLNIMLTPAHQANIMCIQNQCKMLSATFKFPFLHDNKCFSTILQAFIDTCIRRNIKESLVRSQILNRVYTCSPYELWSIYRSITVSDEWRTLEYSVMSHIVESRLSQNQAMRDTLISTGEKVLINADATDSFFGAGEGPRVIRWLNEQDVPGRNYLGSILMGKRAKLRGSQLN